MRIRFIEPIGIDIHVPRAVSVLEKHASSGVFVEVVHLDLPPELTGPMLSPVPLYMNELIATVLQAEEEGADAAIIGCCSDPALMEAQRSVTIPVLGPSAGVRRSGSREGPQPRDPIPRRARLAGHRQLGDPKPPGLRTVGRGERHRLRSDARGG